jgi:hydroxymethylbilane synthase
LALVQARLVADLLESAHPGLAVDLVPIKTGGDQASTAIVPDDKSRFVREIEQALLAGEVDLAVHSAKDLPGDLPEGLGIAGVPAGEDARDALVGAGSVDSLPDGARVGTSSLRRRSQLLAMRADIEVVPLRGNVDTRLRKLAEGQCDAAVLALAGLRRLGRDSEAGAVLDADAFVPAPGQGLLALEALDGSDAAPLAAALEDPLSRARLEAERAVVETLDTSCHTPVGAHARIARDSIDVHAYVGLPDGSEWITDRVECSVADPRGAGAELARRMLTAGAGELLGRAAALG